MDTIRSVISSLHQTIKKKADKERERRAIKKVAKDMLLSSSKNSKSDEFNLDEMELEEESKKRKLDIKEELVLANQIANLIGVDVSD